MWQNFGLMAVRVTAEVALQKMEDDLAAKKLLCEINNRPRILVMLDERALFEKMPSL